MKELREYLSGIAVGVKFRNNYTVEDYLGSIADALLYSKNGGLLNYIAFPYYSSTIDSKNMLLNNDKTGDSLIVNANNIILDVNFSEKILKEKSDELIDEYFKALTQKIYNIVNIREIRMVGLVYKYIIDDEDSSKSIKKTFKDITFDDASSISINFSKKIILPNSKVKKDYNDHENIICTLSMKHEKPKQYLFQVDYQHFFNPMLDSIVDIQYADFIKKVTHYNTEIISQWIKKHEK
jgi:hypothetical protein